MTHVLKNVIIPFHSSYDGKNINKDIPAVVHHGNKNGVVILNYPGANGDIDGYENKYQKMASILSDGGHGTVVRLANETVDRMDWETATQEVLQHAIEYVLENGQELSGSDSPTLYLMGFSAGASAIASICGVYEEVKKVLLIAPSEDAGWDAMHNSLSLYKHELYITAGEDDTYIGMHTAPKIDAVATNTSKKEIITIPNCDHQFKGRENGIILSKAPLWAFAGDTSYPSPEGGMVLYE